MKPYLKQPYYLKPYLKPYLLKPYYLNEIRNNIC